ncbi:geranylgeranyl hydrogenase BchP [Allostella vacuolata]|nr:geranylgeranyl hydrogenase BchP [Stella vacuolata]
MTYDLIIVGGGPAGTAAALYAARAGLRTLLLEKARFPRDKICGDAISGKAVAILGELGLVDGVRRLPGAEVGHILFGSPDHVGADIDLSRAADPGRVTGFVVRRTDFDAFLFAAAVRSGVECREGFAVEDLVLDAAGAVGGVRGRDLATGRPEELAARIVLGADGYRSIVARRAGLYAHDPEHTATGVRAYYRDVGDLSDRIELHYVDAVRPGYLWIFPLGGGAANVGIGMLGGPMKRDGVNLVETLERLVRDRFLAPRFAAAVQIGRTVGWQLPLGSRRRPASGDGFLLLGDAAGLVDPFTGEGIGNAMFSGRRAVATAVQALAEGDTGATSLARYDDALWAEVGDELAVSARLQRIARFRPLLEFTIRRAARSPRVRDMICAMIANELPRKALTRPAFYFDLLFR